MSEKIGLRHLLWIASSKSDYMKMPEEVICDFGHWLYQVQKGQFPSGAKSLSGFGSANVLELKRDHSDGTFRTIYTVKFEEFIVILHAFQKKSKKGHETPKQDMELIKARLKLAEEIYKEWKGKRKK